LAAWVAFRSGGLLDFRRGRVLRLRTQRSSRSASPGQPQRQEGVVRPRRPRPACRAESGRLKAGTTRSIWEVTPPPPPKKQFDRTSWEVLQPQNPILIPPKTGKLRGPARQFKISAIGGSSGAWRMRPGPLEEHRVAGPVNFPKRVPIRGVNDILSFARALCERLKRAAPFPGYLMTAYHLQHPPFLRFDHRDDHEEKDDATEDDRRHLASTSLSPRPRRISVTSVTRFFSSRMARAAKERTSNLAFPTGRGHALSSFLSWSKNRRSVPWAMIFCGVDLISPTPCSRSA